MSFCRACFRMFPYICKEQMTRFAQYAVMYTKVMKLLNSVLNASSRRANLKKW